MPGPTPKLFAVKKAEGNPGKRKLNPGPDYQMKRPKCPANLIGEGRKLFHQLAPVLYDKSLLTVATIPAFIALCQMGGMMHEAKAVLDAGGFTVKTKHGMRTRPEVGILQKASTQFRMYLQEFGLTPTSIQKVPTAHRRLRSIEELISSPEPLEPL